MEDATLISQTFLVLLDSDCVSSASDNIPTFSDYAIP